MELSFNKGIIKSVEGEFPYVLKDLETGLEFPLTSDSVSTHDLREGDLVEFIGRVYNECIYLAISEVQHRAFWN
jgi:hypothetical protein